MNGNSYAMINSLPLDVKIAKTKLRIREFVEEYGLDNVYVSFSGGKDSTVLLHIARSVYPTIKAVYCDNPFEFPEMRRYVNTFKHVDVISSKIPIKKYIEKYGYPVHSKRVSERVYRIRNTKSEREFNRHYHGVNADGSKCKFGLSKKHRHFLSAPFKISSKCCDVYKKQPLKKLNKRPLIGTLAEESSQRKMNYIKNGCNVFGENGYSTPIGFWKEQDILKYVYENKINLCSVYGEVICENGEYKTTGEKRTGCCMCTFGVAKDKDRFVRLKETHNELHDFYINKLGFKEVLDYMEVKY